MSYYEGYYHGIAQTATAELRLEPDTSYKREEPYSKSPSSDLNNKLGSLLDELKNLDLPTHGEVKFVFSDGLLKEIIVINKYK